MRLSYTALKTFQRCRFAFRLRYHYSLPSRPRPRMQLSQTLHAALAAFHQDLQKHHEGVSRDLNPPSGSLETLLVYWDRDGLSPHRLLSNAQYQEGRQLLIRYWEAHGGRFLRPLLVEAPFTFRVGPFRLRGRFDRVDELEDGHEMIDYKLSRRGSLPPDPLQLYLYQLGLHAETGCTASRLSFYDIRSNRKSTIEAGDPEESAARIRGLCRAISAERRFEPSEGAWCDSCDHQEYCPAMIGHPRPVLAVRRPEQLDLAVGW